MFNLPNLKGVKRGSKDYNSLLTERRKIKKQAQQFIVKTILENKDKFDQTMIDAALCLIPKNGRKLTQNKLKLEELSDVFEVIGKKIHEDDIFIKFKYGRQEMKKLCSDIIKKAETPDHRKWISFNIENGFYTFEKTGQQPPNNWLGYLPDDCTLSDIDDLDDIGKNI